MRTQLPVGFEQFHDDKLINYQLNRWYSEGYALRDELHEAAEQISDRATYVEALTTLGERAEAKGADENAAFYYRGAEFMVEPGASRKQELFEKFHTLFYRAFDEEGLERHEVPYESSFLAATTLASRTGDSRGTVVIHRGFDSLIEEFYCFWDYFAALGYDVIAFEGPGQGATHRRYGLPLDHHWEKPVGAVLDYFGVDESPDVHLRSRRLRRRSPVSDGDKCREQPL